MAKPVALLEQMSEVLEDFHRALTNVAQDVEEMRLLLPPATKFVEGILKAMGASVPSSEESEDISGSLTDVMDVEIDFGGNNEAETTLI